MMASVRRTRPRRFAAALILSALGLLASAALAQEPAAADDREFIDWVFVLDTSASMAGKGKGAQEVFPQVKETLREFIRKAKNGDNIIIYTFDERPVLRHNVRLGGENDRNEMADEVMRLTAEGRYTHTGEAVDKALDRIRELQEQNKEKRRTSAIVLFTDGKEDHAPDSRAIYVQDIPQAKIKSIKPYTFVVWLNRQPPPVALTNLVATSERGSELIQYSIPSEIPQAVTKVFETFPLFVKMDPTSVALGEVGPGATLERTINFVSNRGTSLKVALQDADGGVMLVEPTDVVALEDNGKTLVTVRLQTPRDIPDGGHAGKVVFTVDEVILRGGAGPKDEKREPLVFGYSFTVKPLPLWRRLAPWGAGLLLALGLTVAGLVARRQSIERRLLEGELTIVGPQIAEGGGTIRLTQVQAPRVKLSELQTGRLREWLAKADAELSTDFEEGKKLVVIERTQGTLRVQDREVVSERLYNGDLIEIGELKLEFHGRRERPAAPSELEFSEAAF
jgi:von Willebrand factor type A domain